MCAGILCNADFDSFGYDPNDDHKVILFLGFWGTPLVTRLKGLFSNGLEKWFIMLSILNHLFILLIYGKHILMELHRMEDNRMRKKKESIPESASYRKDKCSWNFYFGFIY